MKWTSKKRDVPSWLEADAKVGDLLILADKAMGAGKFEKAQAYASLAAVWQVERARAEEIEALS